MKCDAKLSDFSFKAKKIYFRFENKSNDAKKPIWMQNKKFYAKLIEFLFGSHTASLHCKKRLAIFPARESLIGE